MVANAYSSIGVHSLIRNYFCSAFAGISTTYNITTRMSVVLLIARVLISSLLIYVGYGEVSRQVLVIVVFVFFFLFIHVTSYIRCSQIAMSAGVQHGGHLHMRPEGDGHNNMWPKLVEFSLVPFLLIGL
jgi:hypothetical protein